MLERTSKRSKRGLISVSKMEPSIVASGRAMIGMVLGSSNGTTEQPMKANGVKIKRTGKVDSSTRTVTSTMETGSKIKPMAMALTSTLMAPGTRASGPTISRTGKAARRGQMVHTSRATIGMD